VGLIVLSEPIIGLIYERGEFHRADTVATAQALICYAIGLFPYAALKILVPTFYSLKDTRTPVKISVGCVFINIILNLILMRFMAHMGLALATSISAMINMGSLLILLKKRIKSTDTFAASFSFHSIFQSSYWRILIASSVMGIVCWYINMNLAGYTARTVWGVLAGSIVFMGMCKLLKVEEIESILNMRKVNR
ncbi:MAG: lipid II flippase MurJ, partial [Candidatus Desantisbacteria bacterium]